MITINIPAWIIYIALAYWFVMNYPDLSNNFELLQNDIKNLFKKGS